MPIVIRPAVEADQPTIVSLVRKAHLNPRNLNWQNFLVAEEDGRLVGIRQVKTHAGGTREVGSGYVEAEYRRRGLSARLMEELLSRQDAELYLMCDEKWASYYERFGFKPVNSGDLPGDFRSQLRQGRWITSLLSLFRRQKIRLIPMRREPPGRTQPVASNQQIR